VPQLSAHPLGNTEKRATNMKRKLPIVIIVSFMILFFISSGCKENSSAPNEPDVKDTTGHVIAYKPNIYIYPQTKNILSIKLEFPLGGTVIESIPAYRGEWCIEVEPSGKINNEYDYLFYESQNPDAYQYDSGWIVNRDSLSIFFRTNLSKTGFTEREINDFTEYWVSRLKTNSYYIVYPQYVNDINKIIKLKISTPPDNMLRLFYVIKGSEQNGLKLLEPTLPKYERKGFVVAEWGVVLK
jgi:hypothetical protein